MDPNELRSHETRSGAIFNADTDGPLARPPVSSHPTVAHTLIMCSAGEVLLTTPPSLEGANTSHVLCDTALPLADSALDPGGRLILESPHPLAHTLPLCSAGEDSKTSLPLNSGDPDQADHAAAPAPQSRYQTPISHALRAFLAAQRYLDPDLHQCLYDIGVTDIEELDFVSTYQLPPTFPAVKLTRIQHAAHSTAVPQAVAAPIVSVQPPVVEVDKSRHWAKQFEAALKIVRDCPPLPKEGVFDPTSLGWTLYHQSLKAIFDLVSDPQDPQAPRQIQALMQAIGLNPLPSLESHPKVTEVMLTDSDLLLFRVLTKTLPDAFMQRVLGTDIFTSNSGLRLYYYLCNTSPHDRSQRLLTLCKTLYLQNGCKDKKKLASALSLL